MTDRKVNLLAEIEADVLGDRPLADALRKCVVLGGRAASVELRDWAIRELRGYTPGVDVPTYRTVPAPLFADAITGNAIVQHQRISPSMLPNFVQDDIKEEFTFYNGVGELEAMIRCDTKDQVKLGLPMALDLARVMDEASDNPFQQITSLYWGVSKSSLRGIVDQIKTTLAELVSEMRAGTPADQGTPSADLAAHAVNVAVHGKSARVTVNTAQAASHGTASVGLALAEDDSLFWTRGRKIGAFVVGLTTGGAAVAAIAEAIW